MVATEKKSNRGKIGYYIRKALRHFADPESAPQEEVLEKARTLAYGQGITMDVADVLKQRGLMRKKLGSPLTHALLDAYEQLPMVRRIMASAGLEVPPLVNGEGEVSPSTQGQEQETTKKVSTKNLIFKLLEEDHTRGPQQLKVLLEEKFQRRAHLQTCQDCRCTFLHNNDLPTINGTPSNRNKDVLTVKLPTLASLVREVLKEVDDPEEITGERLAVICRAKASQRGFPSMEVKKSSVMKERVNIRQMVGYPITREKVEAYEERLRSGRVFQEGKDKKRQERSKNVSVPSEVSSPITFGQILKAKEFVNLLGGSFAQAYAALKALEEVRG